MRQNNLYTVNPLYGDGQVTPGTSKSGEGTTTIIYQGGGNGMTSEQKQKLDSIENGAQVNQDAFANIKLGDGIQSTLLKSRIPSDTVDLAITGGGSIKVQLVTSNSIDNVTASYKTDKGNSTYLFNYAKKETINPEPPVEGQPIKPPIITWPLLITYVAGDRLKVSELLKIQLLNKNIIVDTFTTSQFSLLFTDGNIDQITILKEGLYFDQVNFIGATVKDEIVIDTILSTYKVLVQKHNIINISSAAPELWKLDAKGNVYTDLNVYSTKEISAYGKGTGGGSSDGAGALYECADVLRDGDKVQGALTGALLSYNGTHWYGIPQSSITPDLSSYATTLAMNAAISKAVNGLIDSAPGTLDTLNEIAAALGDDPNFAATITGLLNTISLRVTDLEGKLGDLTSMFEWDKSASTTDKTKWIIKAKNSIYSVGEVSAYGYMPTDTPVGAQYLYELKDVSFTDLTAGQLLNYNGIKWTNVNANEVGLNESQLAAYLTTNNYAKKTDIPSLSGYATESWVNGKNYALQATSINAGAGLIGGGTLAANRVLSLATLNTNGTYSKVITDIYGRVVSGSNATIADISGLQNALNAKLNIADFNKWFTIELNADGSVKSIKALYNFYSVGEISAYGIGIGEVPTGAQYMHELKDVLLTNVVSGQLLKFNGIKWVNINANEVGLNETQLLAYLTSNNYAKKTDIPSLTGYATQTWVISQGYLAATTTDKTNWNTAYTWGNHASANYLKAITKSQIEGVLTGNITTHTHDIYATDTEIATANSAITALKAITISAGIGLTGGGNLTANRTLALATVGTAGTYTKVTVDAYGRISNGTILLAGDIPVLAINKIIGLQKELDSKINIAEIDKWFTIIYNADKTIKSIQANYSFYSLGEVSAYGVGDGESPSGAQYLTELKDVSITTPVNRQALVYDSATSKWINGSAGLTSFTVNVGSASYNSINGIVSLPAYPTTLPWNSITSKPTVIIEGDIRLTNARSASDVYVWAKAATKPAYSYSEINGTPPATDLSNYVTLNTTQIITGQKTIHALYFGNHSGVSTYLAANGSIRCVSISTNNGTASQLLRADGGIATFNWAGQAGQPSWLWGGNAQHTYQLYNPANFRVANANTVGDIAASNLVTKQNWTSVVDGRYLPLTGGTIDGQLNINYVGTYSTIFNGTGTHAVNSYRLKGVSKADIGFMENHGVYMYNATANRMIRLDNNGEVYFSDGEHNINHKFWHAGNDGSGSGLDADLWRGLTPDSMNVASATKLSTNRTNYKGVTDANVVGELMWKAYGKGHTIFDASNSTAPNGTSIDNINPQMLWTTTHPTLMGWNGVETYGVRVDCSSRTDKLATSRAIWGQLFNGASDINGSMYIIGPTANVASHIMLVNGNSGRQWGIKAGLYGSNENDFTITDDIATHAPSLTIKAGTMAVALGGDLHLPGWIYSNGDVGWYSNTYSGGIHMIDSNYVRIYNNKRFYVANSGMDAVNADGGLYSNGENGHGLTIIGSETTTTRIKGQIGSGINEVISRYEVQWYNDYVRFDVHRGQGTNIIKFSWKHNDSELASLGNDGLFSVNGNIVASREITAFSDERLKSNIQNLSYRGKLRPKTFYKDNKQQLGFIAQEVQMLYPELISVGTDEQHYLSMNYGAATAVLSAQLNMVEDEVTILKQKIQTLEEKINQYESINK